MGSVADFGYCRLCAKQLDSELPECPHCGQRDPIDRFEDLEAGRVYDAEHVAPILEDLHWFRLIPSGRCVFARVSSAREAAVFRSACERSARHRLECCGFPSRYPSFRYLA